MWKNIFAKYEGAGNDFILIDDRTFSFPIHDSHLIQRLCHRKFGVGADGLILLQNSAKADFRMRIFNADGSEAESCGNGLRCLGRFLIDQNILFSRVAIETVDRIVHLFLSEDQIGVEMGYPKDLRLHISTENGICHFVDTGVPHVVQFVQNVSQLPIQTLGTYFRHHKEFSPKGANVNFVEKQSSNSFKVRTFERGVEGETLACGTGACAAFAICSQFDPNLKTASIHFPGGTLMIEIRSGLLIMKGPANRVFEGRWAF